MDEAGIRESFDAQLSVKGESTWKPVLAAYTHAAKTCGVKPDQMLLVAVHPWDIHAAARSEMRTA